MISEPFLYLARVGASLSENLRQAAGGCLLTAGHLWLAGAAVALTGWPEQVESGDRPGVDLQSPPDTLPKVTGALVVPVPETLKGTPAPGYAIVETVIDAKGKALAGPCRANYEVERAVTQSTGRLKFELRPVGGKPVNALGCCGK
ncbi:MAG: hypothetical protein U1F61_17865 [Opitutaceae bacterium]